MQMTKMWRCPLLPCLKVHLSSGIMRHKRPAPGAIAPAEIHIPAHFLEARATEQDAGTNFYGQAIRPPAKRVRHCHARSCFPFIDCYQGDLPTLVLLSSLVGTCSLRSRVCCSPSASSTRASCCCTRPWLFWIILESSSRDGPGPRACSAFQQGGGQVSQTTPVKAACQSQTQADACASVHC